MVNFTKILFLVSTATAIIIPRDAVTVEADISQKIGPAWTTFDNDVNGFPASGLSGALAIHSDVLSIIVTEDNATADVQSAGSFSEAEGTTILADIQSLVPTILGALSAISSQAAAWNDIPGGQALILSDIQGLNSSSIAFFDALIAASPADLVPAATSVKVQIAGAFSSAISAYSD